MNGVFTIVKKYLAIGLVAVSLFTATHSPASANGLSHEELVGTDYEFKIATLNSDRLLEEYRLNKYDIINIMVVGFPDGIGVSDIMVGPDGYVQLPYAGMVKLAGLTVSEATELIREKLGEYIKIPAMSVMMKSYGPRKVYVLGEVKSPGLHELSIDSMDVFAAISSASGIALKGRPKHVQILRVIDDKMYIKEVNLDAYTKKHDITQNIRLLDGDMVYVPSSNKIDLNQDIMPLVSLYGIYHNLTN